MTEDQLKTGNDSSASRGGGFTRREEIGIPFWSFEGAGPKVRVYFSTRNGGVSKPPYDTLNLSFHVHDDPNCVHKNRKLWSKAVGTKPRIITSPRQRHSPEVAVLENDLDIGAGSTMIGSNPFDPCDALITALQTAPIQLHFADCVPLVLSAQSRGHPLIGVVHAGRKSLMAGVISNAVSEMVSIGADPTLVTAAIGPAIGRCCYEVDAGTASLFAGRFGEDFVEKGRLDLKGAATAELKGMGIQAGNIHDIGICTSCDEEFFSYRRDGPITGRQGAIAWIE